MTLRKHKYYGTFVLLFVLLLLVQSCASLPRFGRDEEAGLETQEYAVTGSKRGVVIDFLPNKPTNEIFGDFTVGLVLGNYGQYQQSVRLDLWDTSPLRGFTDVQDVTLSLEPALIERGEFIEPSISNYDLGIFRYNGVKPGDKTQFVAQINYDYQSELETHFCVSNPDYEKESSCSDQETISGNALGFGSKYDPVTVTSMKKTFVGAGEGLVLLTLDMTISNKGGGDIVDFYAQDPSQLGIMDIVRFDLYGLDESFTFECRSPQLYSSTQAYGVGDFGDVALLGEGQVTLPLTLQLERNKATVRCTSPFFIEEPLRDVRVKLLIDHGYQYTISTPSISVNG